MKRPDLRGALTAFVIVGLAHAPVREQTAWGEAVDGVQLRLAVSKDAPPRLPGELPRLEAQIRNGGPLPVAFTAEAIVFGSIEIDGTWYQQTWAGSCCSHPTEVGPSAQSGVLPLRTVQALMFAIGATPARTLELRPGRHAIRLRTVSSDLYDVHTSARRGMTLTSNEITIDIPDLSPAAEQQALVEQASAGGVDGIEAARRLVEKYPSTAVDALATAVARARDPGLRSEFVGVAGTLPGNLPVAFLISQLERDVDLLSQVRAADALNARGRVDWLQPLVAAWRRILRQSPGTMAEQNAEAALIDFLVRSANAEAIAALGDNAQAPADVRVAVVHAFLPRPVDPNSRTSSSTGSSLIGMIHADLPALPDGPAGAAVDRLLGAALDDTGQRLGWKGTYDGVTYVDPRVCDVAAFVLARRWPGKYQFTWPATLRQRDAQIDVIRSIRRPSIDQS